MKSVKIQPRGWLWQIIFPQKSSLYLSGFEIAVEFGFKQEAAGWGAKSYAGTQDIKEATCLLESLVLLVFL